MSLFYVDIEIMTIPHTYIIAVGEVIQKMDNLICAGDEVKRSAGNARCWLIVILDGLDIVEVQVHESETRPKYLPQLQIKHRPIRYLW